MLEWSIIVSSKISTTPVVRNSTETHNSKKLNCTHSQTSVVELVNHFVQKNFLFGDVVVVVESIRFLVPSTRQTHFKF